jgi:hypothetical protein
MLVATLGGLVACAGASTVTPLTTSTPARKATATPARATATPTNAPNQAAGKVETEVTPTPAPANPGGGTNTGEGTSTGGGSNTGGTVPDPAVTEAPTPTPEPLSTAPPLKYVTLTVRNVTPIKLTVPPTSGTPSPGIKGSEALDFEWTTNRGSMVLNAKFSVEPANIAVVSSSGIVTAKSEGTGNLKIIAPDDSTYSLVPIIIEAVGSLNLEVE